ncbi:hypothetical protein M0804_012943 [Polistes exclamans]|nr:hypothetical protein M0804_012943 [Polistes exclamans]
MWLGEWRDLDVRTRGKEGIDWCGFLTLEIKEKESSLGCNIGTYFILYDFIDFFDKDTASFLERDKFVGIIDTIFKNMSQIERDAIKFQYTDWEKVKDGYVNQRMIADVVGDYFFICPSIHFAQLFADRGMKVYYYFFTQCQNETVPMQT